MARLSLGRAILLLFFTIYGIALGNSACSSFPYDDLLFLSSYKPAEAFCTQYYPQPAVTTTVTVKAAKLRRALALDARAAKSTTASRTTSTKPCTTSSITTAKSSSSTSITSRTTSTSVCTGACATWASVTKEAASFLSTLCSCIESPSTVTKTKTSSTTASTTASTTTTSSTPLATACSTQQLSDCGGDYCLISVESNAAIVICSTNFDYVSCASDADCVGAPNPDETVCAYAGLYASPGEVSTVCANPDGGEEPA